MVSVSSAWLGATAHAGGFGLIEHGASGLGNVYAGAGAAEISSPETENPGTLAVVPNLYYVASINDKWSYGLSIGVPFGSSTEWTSKLK